MHEYARRFRPHPSLARHLPHPGEGCCGGSVRVRGNVCIAVERNGMLAPSARPHPSFRATFPLKGEGCCSGMVALRGSTRRFRPHPALACHLPHPGEGLGWVRLLKNYLPSKATLCRKIGAVSKSHETAVVAFPRVGKVSRQRRMRAKSASVQHNAMHPTITTP